MDPSPLLALPGAVTSPTEPELAWHYGDPLGEQRVRRTGGLVLDGWAQGTVDVGGPDRLTWLHSLASQDFLTLAAGDTTMALWLSARGHIQHAARVEVRADRVELQVETVAAAAALAEFLVSMRFRSDVDVADVSGQVARLTVVGDVKKTSMTVPRGEFGARAEALFAAGVPGGTGPCVPAGTWARDALAVAARTPRLGVDTDDRTLPHEIPAWLSGAVALEKGCYCGQETVSRIENIGAPPRRLVLLNLDGSGDVLPTAGEKVTQPDGRPVGRVGTVAQHWEDGPIALALVKRTIAPGEPLLAGEVTALIDPDDVVPPGPKMVYDRSQFIDLRRR